MNSYSFLFNGFDDNGTVLIAGNFSADGNGNILSGEEVINRVNPGGSTYAVVSATLTGTYALGTDGRGTMQLIATNQKTAIFTANYLLAIDSSRQSARDRERYNRQCGRRNHAWLGNHETCCGNIFRCEFQWKLCV